MPATVYDLTRAILNRDKGLAQAASNDTTYFNSLGIMFIASLPRGFEYTGEEINALLTARGITPRTHKGWGALINDAVRKGLLVDTRHVTQMRKVTSNARRTPIWRRP